MVGQLEWIGLKVSVSAEPSILPTRLEVIHSLLLALRIDKHARYTI